MRRSWRHRPPLTLSFAVLSLALTAGLGAVLAVQLRSTIHQRSVEDLTKATNSGIALTTNLILVQYTQAPGAPLTSGEEARQLSLMNAAAQTLIRDGDSVGIEIVLLDGTVIGGTGASPPGAKVVADAHFRAAATGTTQTHALYRSQLPAASQVEQGLLRQHGDLLLLQIGVRAVPGGPVNVVVRTYAPMAPSEHQAAADLANMLRLLILGLVVFWAAMFRLVVGASRALTRESKANIHLLTHDAPTGLPNQALLRDRLEAAIATSHRAGSHVAVLLVDLDRLKQLQDTVGRHQSDTMLQLIGPRLRRALREADTIARISNDEFVVVIPDLRSPEQAVLIAEKLVATLDKGFDIDGDQIDVGVSVGVAVAPEHGEDPDDLLQRARTASETAKQDSLRAVLYSPDLETGSRPHLGLVSALRRAIDQPGEIVLHYQPQANLASGEVTSVEALVRWQHPTLGLLAPDAFIPLAETTGIIRPLTQHILRLALTQCGQWAEHGIHLRVAVNVSARCLLDPAFPDEVDLLLRQTGVPVERLELEITETAMMANPDHALGILRKLDARGVRLSIDDFGTGYASLAYLKDLPVRELKIDRLFVTGMADNPSDQAIVRSSIELARTLHLDTVAEGVETLGVLTQLADLGCTQAQGYYLSKPLPPADLGHWLTSRSAQPHRRRWDLERVGIRT